MLILLDWFLFLFHSGLIAFNLTGWAFRKTRRAHLITTGVTILSWFVLGAWCGWGYCPPTAWHWHIKRQLGETDLPNSYIKYYADRLTGMDWNPLLVDSVTLVLGVAALMVALLVNYRDWRSARRRDNSSQQPDSAASEVREHS
jgi:hypothetical protein